MLLKREAYVFLTEVLLNEVHFDLLVRVCLFWVRTSTGGNHTIVFVRRSRFCASCACVEYVADRTA